MGIPTALLLLAAACGEAGEVRPIERVRTYAPATPRELESRSAEVRFLPPGRRSGARRMAAAASPQSFSYEVPLGWRELPPEPMKAVNLLVAGQSGAECYLTVLAGGGGLLEENIARWRRQMGQPPLDAAAIAALPRVQLLGGEAVQLVCEGAFRGQDGYTMVAVLRDDGASAYSLKMVGPTELIRAERAAFEGLRASLDWAEPSAPAARADESGGGLRWAKPESWTSGRTSSMRVATFHPKSDPSAECAVFVFAGSGGTELMNVQRWYGQMGRAAPASLEGLEQITLLGRQVHLVELTGTYTNTGAGEAPAPQSALLAVFCELPDRGVCVRMSGPVATVRAEKQNFLALCASLRRDG